MTNNSTRDPVRTVVNTLGVLLLGLVIFGFGMSERDRAMRSAEPPPPPVTTYSQYQQPISELGPTPSSTPAPTPVTTEPVAPYTEPSETYDEPNYVPLPDVDVDIDRPNICHRKWWC